MLINRWSSEEHTLSAEKLRTDLVMMSSNVESGTELNLVNKQLCKSDLDGLNPLKTSLNKSKPVKSSKPNLNLVKTSSGLSKFSLNLYKAVSTSPT